MQPTEAIILAGGFGTRLKKKISQVPKPMAPVGDKPFLAYLLDYLNDFGITHIILSVGYKWEVIRDQFGDRYKSAKLSYAVENEPLGTGGGMRTAMKFLEGDHTFILNGDTFFRVDLNDLGAFYFAHQADLSMAVRRMDNISRYGTVELNVCKVTGFREKQQVRAGYINGGVYITSKYLFDPFHLPEKFSFEEELLTQHLDALKICAMNSTGYFIDIGVPEDYEKAIRELPQMIQAGGSMPDHP